MSKKQSIKSIRKNMNMTQTEFANYLGFKYYKIKRLEQGVRYLTAEELKIISDKCHIPMEDIDF